MFDIGLGLFHRDSILLSQMCRRTFAFQWGFLTFDMKVTRTGSCNGRVKFVKRWPAHNSESVDLTGNYVEATADSDGWRRVIIPTHDFKTCEWPELDQAKDMIFENCPSGENPKYEVRNIKLTDLTDTQEHFANCNCDCEDGSHDVFVDNCVNPTTAAPPPEPTTIFKDLSDLSGDAGELLEWSLQLPSERTHLYCKTWGGTGNVALYVNWGSQVNTLDAEANTVRMMFQLIQAAHSPFFQ